ncbi:MAG: TIGR01777 family protein [Chloroflexi bacterium GWB2_49_20]|nr:MAG: TIGR01777 family protein [Chloroflexi bacterium GWB2_49_20]OGN78242.1 MAG: TIGR01777 family protein [Chloroflexi bacterium GWC2_49_37]OGN85278.1 MAG: TIGR01777 family protein [Chloroflexi bacterium GWD2_49_16]
MRILISGGTGMIGRPLVTRLQESGHQLWILTRKIGARHNLKNIQMVHWDGSRLGEWSEYVNQVDAIINLAGENIGAKRWSDKRKKQIIESRVNAGEILTEAIKQARKRPRVFVQASAIGFYGVNRHENLTEASASGDDFLADICIKWEESSNGLESLGIRRVVIRTGVVLSKNEGALNRMLIPFKLFVGGPIGGGRQMISWIHPFDEIAAIQYMLENDELAGVFNLTAPEPISNADLGRYLARITHRPYWLPVPAFALRILLGEMCTLVLDGQNVTSLRLVDAGFQFKYGKIEDALKNLLA